MPRFVSQFAGSDSSWFLRWRPRNQEHDLGAPGRSSSPSTPAVGLTQTKKPSEIDRIDIGDDDDGAGNADKGILR
jgi:hypothetical protein